MIYVGSPYSHADPIMEDYRYLKVMEYCSRLIKEGKFPFSPIVHFHPMHLRYNLPGDAEFWWDYNVEMMKACDEMHILRLAGHETSTGVRMEVDYWQTYKNTPVNYVT